ncbi:MAG: protein-glutamate O-methyltransferase CheR [Nannocystaceae bacterium]|nr:protein-glutamate O-methyltransferase CheR [Nannocystaceae bacterium]
MNFVRKFIYERSAIVIGPDKDYLVESRLLPIARKRDLDGVDGIVKLLQSRRGGPLEGEVVEAITTNETYFFRDQHPFDTLKGTVLPEMVERRASSRKLRIWCGAASTGQEPYSILMTIFEGLPDPGQWDIDFVATDINETVLEQCRAGRYKQHEVNRGLPASLLLKYFDRSGMEWVVQERLRKAVTFRTLNLADGWPFLGKFDIIFLRNVLIYFDVKMKASILERARGVLAEDGALFLGGAETTLNLDRKYESVRDGRGVFYRKVA